MLLGDRGYVSEPLRHQLDARYGVTMIAIHRANMQPNTPAEQRLFRMHRKRIETCNRQLEKMGVARIHARLTAGVSLKIAASLCALSVCQITPRLAIKVQLYCQLTLSQLASHKIWEW